MDIKVFFLQWSYKFFDKNSVLFTDKSASGGGIKNENVYDNALAKELHKPIIRIEEKESTITFY